MTVDEQHCSEQRGEGIFASDDEKFCFIAVEFYKVVFLNFRQAVGYDGKDNGGDGFGEDVQLGVVGLTMKVHGGK